MFIVRVIPIARGIFKDHLTFFSRNAIAPGAIVSATVRGRAISGLVIESKDVREEKLDLKASDFSLKKLSTTVSPKHVFSGAFVSAVKEVALWHGVHEGAVLHALTSQTILGALPKLEQVTETVRDTEKVRPEFLILQAEKSERITTYRNLVREAFAKNASVMIITPTTVEAEILSEELKRGIEDSVLLLTSDLTKKKLIETWNHAVKSPAPLLIVGTPLVLSMPRPIDTLIIERESARSYRSIHRPHLDTRRVAESISRHTGCRLILADFPVRIETRFRVDEGTADELSRSQVRPAGSASVRIVDTRKKDGDQKAKKTFSPLSDETKKAIEKTIARGGRVVVFAVRKGIAPLTVCNDCGTPITDPSTGTPMVLHRTNEGNVFISHRSGAILSAHTACTLCGGWNLVTLGIGVDRVADDIEKTFPEATLAVFTKETTPTHKVARKIAEQFFATKGAVLVGTERMLPYLLSPVDLIVVASVDSLLSLSAWRAHEHTLSILFYLRERAHESFIVETRKPESEVMKVIASGNPLDFYRSDIEERERYDYPPFSVFVGIAWSGTKLAVEKMSAYISAQFKDTDLVGPLPPTASGKNEWMARAVIRVPKKDWPDASLVERIRELPPTFHITVDPDEIV